MRNLLKAGFVAIAAAAAFAAAPTMSALAAPPIPMINNGTPGPGEGGYFVNDNGGTRIRDVQFTTVVTAQMENLTGIGGAPGGAGGELCNDNTGWAAQVGLVWNGSAFLVEYNYVGDTTHFIGGVNAPGPATQLLQASPLQDDQDPCVEGGLLNDGSGHLGQVFNNFLNKSTDTTSINSIHIGDVLSFEIYYNPKGHFGFHNLTFKVHDISRNITRVQTVNVPAQNFYEAGVGVVSMNTGLTGGAVNLINTFTGASFNYYSSRHGFGSINVPAHWDLEEADFVNGSNQVTLTPGPLNSAGNSFSMLEGSTSA